MRRAIRFLIWIVYLLAVAAGRLLGQSAPAAAGSVPGTGTPQDFDFLIGAWDITYNSKAPGIPPKVRGRWTATRQADGRLIADEFRLFGADGATVALGMTYRVFDPSKKVWNARYVDAVNSPLWHEGRAWRDGPDIRLDQRTPAGAILRIRYSDITPETFRWRADRSTDGGKTWVADAIRIEARREGPPAQAAREPVAGIVARIQQADYEGDRPALRRLYEELAPYVENREIASRVLYWRGFALWRRALNGFNESAARQEQENDLGGCVRELERAAAKDPGLVDARVGKASCLVGLFLLDRTDARRRQAYLDEFEQLQADAKTAAAENPRVLWFVGGGTWYVPAEKGGGQARAMEIYRKGLEAARRKRGAASDPLDPSWGEPELLMNLAWANLNRATPDLDAAEANARAALALVPYWHYVRDMLLPQILEARAKGTASPGSR